MPTPLKLDLGSGPRPEPGFTGVDRLAAPGVVQHRFESGDAWPFRSGSVEELRSSHLIEHLPPLTVGGQDCLVLFMEEAWRVAEVGALFHLRWPAPIDDRETSAEAGRPPRFLPSSLWDPTHYRLIPREQIEIYMSLEGRRRMGVEFYGWQCNWVTARPTHMRILNEHVPIIEYDALLRKEPL